MKKLYIKQKVLSLRGHFTVKDAMENDQYFVEGSFMSIPKTFTVTDSVGNKVGEIIKKPISFLPRFFVEVLGKEEVVIEKEFTFIKSRYKISGENLSVQGDWINKNFEVYKGTEKVAVILEKWLTWGDAYEIEVLDESLEELIICFVIALDYVKESERAASSSSNSSS